MVGFIFFNKSKPPRYDGPKKINAERLHFDKNLVSGYDKLIGLHRVEIRKKDALIRETKNKL